MTSDVDNIKSMIPDQPDGFLKNITELLGHYRNNNVQCLVLAYRREDKSGTRVFMIGKEDPAMFKLMCRLEHDMLGISDEDADVTVFEL